MLVRHMIHHCKRLIIKCRSLFNYRKSNEDTFDRVYQRKLWGGSDFFSGDGSYRYSEYVSVVTKFIKEKKIQSAMDIGCGDFTITKRLLEQSDSLVDWIAVDCSSLAIERAQRYTELHTNLSVAKIDACYDLLPKVDLILVRQVFQHLSNSSIEKILYNIENHSNPRFVIVTENVPTSGFTPNKDLVAGFATRLIDQSGVVLDAHPFNVNWRNQELIKVDAEPQLELESCLVTNLWTLSRDKEN